MRLLLTLLLLTILNFFGQETQSKKLNSIFIDKCTNQVVEVKHLSNFKFEHSQTISGVIERVDWNGQFIIHLDLSTKHDTIIIPEILMYDNKNTVKSTENGFEILDNWVYLKCGEICDGTVTEYSEDGEKFKEGIFKNGKPLEIMEYDSNGIISNHQYFELGNRTYFKIEYFDNLGELMEYEIHVERKNKTIYKTYNKNGKMTERKVVNFEMI